MHNKTINDFPDCSQVVTTSHQFINWLTLKDFTCNSVIWSPLYSLGKTLFMISADISPVKNVMTQD